ncbi:MAG: porin [Pseudomonadales bacterium]|nr:porin [Pseudomonadales bacterium]
MKRLSLLVMSALAINASAEVANMDVYGEINVSLHATDNRGENDFSLQSNASYIGVKADKQLNSAIRVFSKIEYEIQTDGNTNQDAFRARDIYVGVDTDYGNLLTGRKDSPMKTLGKKVDRFNDYYMGDISAVVEGEQRQSDMVMYQSQRLGGFQLSTLFTSGELDSSYEQLDNMDFGGGSSTVLDYDAGLVSIGLGVDDNINARDQYRAAMDIKFSGFTLAGMVQESEFSEQALSESGMTQILEQAFVVSAEYQRGKWTYAAQYGKSEWEQNSSAYGERSQTVMGLEYQIDSQIKLFTYAARNTVLESPSSAKANSFSEEDDKFTLALGFEFDF